MVATRFADRKDMNIANSDLGSEFQLSPSEMCLVFDSSLSGSIDGPPFQSFLYVIYRFLTGVRILILRITKVSLSLKVN